jgi:hypothetical protein
LTAEQNENNLTVFNHRESALSPIDRGFRLRDGVGSLGLRRTSAGVSLAGAPLLRKTVAGSAPRPADEIAALMRAAYGCDAEPADPSAGLAMVA